MAQWTFAKAPDVGFVAQGPNNSTAQHFKAQDIFSALVRESIQNSLDVPSVEGEPVEVRYSFGVIDNEWTDALKAVEEHVKACVQEYPDSEVYHRMQDFLETHQEKAISYLKVSDYHTTGMKYIKDARCGFSSFVRSIGVSDKPSAGSGGSYGFGKAAYYEFSNSRSILVSSRSTDGSFALQGCSMLCTHVLDGQKYISTASFDNGDGEPIQDEALVPEKFHRKEAGSDIYILNVDNDIEKMLDYGDSLVRSVLLNFWMAIHSKKLIVSFDWEDDGNPEIEINADTLPNLMDEYYPNMSDIAEDGQTKYYCNPRPYYEAVKKATPFNPLSEEEQSCVYFYNDNLPYVGKIRFYLMRNEHTKDRYLRMRHRLMVIDAVPVNGQRGFSGVLVCESGVANDTLNLAEPPSHDKWDDKLVVAYKDRPGAPEWKAWKALNAIRRYAKDCMLEFFKHSTAKDLEVDGLENYLYSAFNVDNSTGNGVTRNGEETGNNTNQETGVHQTQGDAGKIFPGVKSVVTGNVTIKTKQPIGDNPGGNVGPTFPVNPPHPTPPTPPNPEPYHPTVDPQDDPSVDSPKVLQSIIKPVSFRVLVQKDADGLLYTLKMRTNEDLSDAQLFITTQGEDGEEIIPLAYSSIGRIANNIIKGVNLKKEDVNIITLRFEDNIKHLISLTTYVTE